MIEVDCSCSSSTCYCMETEAATCVLGHNSSRSGTHLQQEHGSDAASLSDSPQLSSEARLQGETKSRQAGQTGMQHMRGAADMHEYIAPRCA